MSEPFVSVVSPFRNTAPYLRQCLDSVLAQTHTEFEYILSDNCSTDGSGDIAEEYAHRDSRIRFIRQPQLLPQGDHYNNALTYISDASQYCKIVQADDCILPDCVQAMVKAFEQSESIGLVSAYFQKGDAIFSSGFPHGKTILPGKEMGRLFLRGKFHSFGSETSVMYKASLVRNCRPFFNGSLLHMDTEKCMQLLQEWDFGFVPQVLSFLRTDNVNESISSGVRSLQPGPLDWYIVVQRYADAFLEKDEARALKERTRQEYYSMLANEKLRLREAAFWQYHRKGLNTLGETLSMPYLYSQVAKTLLWMVVNPGATVARVLNLANRKGANPPAKANA